MPKYRLAKFTSECSEQRTSRVSLKLITRDQAFYRWQPSGFVHPTTPIRTDRSRAASRCASDFVLA